MRDDDAPEWLPDLVEFDWNKYQQSLENAYAVFSRDFGTPRVRPSFRGKRMGLKHHPEFDGKSATFWHFVTEGSVEADRTPDRERVERIAWPRAMIVEAEGSLSRVLVWRNERHKSERWVVALADFCYVVILDDRGDFVLPWTAFTVKEGHRRRKLEKEYNAWVDAQKG